VQVIDALCGRRRHVVALPPEGRTEGEPVLVGGHVVVAARDADGTHHLSAHSLETGETAWTRPLAGASRVCGLVADGDGVLVLQSDGTLGRYRAADGAPLEGTKVYAGEGADACAFHGTEALVDGDRLVLMPRVASPPWYVGAWDRHNGRLLWQAPFERRRSPSRSQLALSDGGVVCLTPYTPPQEEARIVLTVLDRETGEVRQQIEPVGLAADYGLVSLVHGYGSVVVFGRAGAVLYAGGR
jgi:hypothetical protein